MRIKHLDLKPGRVNTVTGDNESGKSSFLKAIREVFVSSGTNPDLIHTDARRGVVKIELPVGIFTRTLTQRSNTLSVDADEIPEDTTPAKWAKALADGSLWDPIGFFQLGDSKAGRRKQRNMLLEMISFRLDAETLKEYVPAEVLDGVDFEQHGMVVIEEVRKRVYDLRTVVNVRKIEKEKAHAVEMEKLPVGFSPDTIQAMNVDAIQARLEAANTHNQSIDASNTRCKDLQGTMTTYGDQLTVLKIQKQELEDRIAVTISNRKQIEALLDEEQRDRVTLGERRDTAPIMEDMKRITQIQRWLGIAEMAAENLAESGRLSTRHAELERLHKRLKDEIPGKLTAELEMPMDGLTFDEERVYVDGYALEHLSRGRQLKVAFELAAHNGRQEHGLDFILVDNLESLGTALRAEVDEIIYADEVHQYFVAERTDGPLSITSTREGEGTPDPSIPTHADPAITDGEGS